MPGETSDRYVIADWLRAEIAAGTFPPGSAVPSEAELINRFQVAKQTARAAVALLKAEGLLESRQGAATRVRAFRPILRSSDRRLAADTWGSGRSIWSVDEEGRTLTVDNVTVTEEAARDSIAADLDVPAGTPLCIRSRRYILDGRPVMLATSHLPLELVAGTQITQHDTGAGGIYARLADLGQAPARFEEYVRARLPLKDERAALDLAVGSPVIEIKRRALTADGRPVEVNEMVADAAAYVLRYDLDA